MGDKTTKTVKVDQSKAEQWDDYVSGNAEVDSVSHLIRLSVQKEMSGKYDVDERRSGGENSGTSGEVLTKLQDIQTAIGDVEGRLSALEEVETEKAGYDMKKTVFSVLPPTPDDVVTATEEPEIPDVDGFPEATGAVTAQEVARQIGADVSDVEDTLNELVETTGQVHRSDVNHDGNHYWKEAQ